MAALNADRFLHSLSGPSGASGTDPTHIVPLTTLPGLEVEGALSPDGERLAFLHIPPGSNENRTLYVLRLGADAPVRLVDSENGRISSPTWSPGGRELAYLRQDQDRVEIVVHAFDSDSERVLVGWTHLWVGRLAWSPRGDRMSMSVGERRDQPIAIHWLDLTTLEHHPWTSPPAGSVGDVFSAWSPSGDTLAFIRRKVRGIEDVFIVNSSNDSDGDSERRLTHLTAKIPALAWSDDATLMLARYDGAVHRLWQLGVSGELTILPRYGVHPVGLSLAAGRWVFCEFTYDANLHLVDTANPEKLHPPPIASTAWDASPDISPDGSRIAFSSDRGGSSEIWTADLRGGNPVKHTTFEGPLTTHPQFSPDGRYLAFDSRGDEDADIFVVGTGFGRPKRVTRHEGDDLRPTWSRDGGTLYFASNRGGTWNIWRRPVRGGEATQVTTDGGLLAVEDLDGSLVYSKADQPGLWRLVSGREPELWIESLSKKNWGNWALGTKAIFYIRTSGDGEIQLVRRDRTAATETTLRRLSGTPENPGLALTPNGRFLVYSIVDRVESDLRLVGPTHP